MVYVFIYAVLKYWMVLVLMGYDYVEHCTSQCNYLKLEGLLNTITKRNVDLWLSPRHGLSSIPDCATDATVIPWASHIPHLNCKRGKQYFLFPFLSLFCVFGALMLRWTSWSYHKEGPSWSEAAHQSITPMARKGDPALPGWAAGWSWAGVAPVTWGQTASQPCTNCWNSGILWRCVKSHHDHICSRFL